MNALYVEQEKTNGMPACAGMTPVMLGDIFSTTTVTPATVSSAAQLRRVWSPVAPKPWRRRKAGVLFSVFLFIAFFSFAASAQEAPAPRNAPRTPVTRQVLVESKPAPVSHQVQGQATIIDGERLRVGDVDLRLFGIVPPQLSASFGPQARSTLDSLTSWQPVTCQIHDRDHDGRMLAVCRTANNNDLALELLRRGLAVTARGSLSSSDLAATYLAAEQAAQNQKIGLWSMTLPAPAAVVSPAKTDAPKIDVPKTDSVTASATPAAPAPAIDAKKDDSAKTKAATDAAAAAITSDAQAQQADAINASDLEPDSELPVTDGGFFARYQILIAGILMLATVLGIMGVLSIQRRAEKRDEMKAIAAALRGELMAARAVCLTRIKTITSDAEDKAAVWPRIRSTLYQAYVGRVGWLGAELARQIASIYGQASDYAAYYSSADEASATPKRQALQTLVHYIEEVLPRLAMIEQTGRLPSARMMPQFGTQPQPAAKATTPPQVVTEAAKKPAPAIANTASAIAGEKPAAGEGDAPATEAAAESATPIWKAVKKFARDKLADKPDAATEEAAADYASLIEQDMANLSFGETGEDTDALHPDGEKLRGTGS